MNPDMAPEVTTARPQGPARTGPVDTGRAFALLLLLAGGLGLAASVTLTLEKIRLLENPHYIPSCNINPIISCGSVMRTAQASAFGFPNSLIGVAGFAVVMTIGAGALAGARYRRWFWLGLQAGTLFGIVFVHWLITQTLYRIGAVCPYCVAVWTAMIPLFWYTTLHNLRHGVIPTPDRWRPGIAAVTRYHWVVPALWYLVIALMVLNRFWYYWSTL
ncbi:vitamin K epoxide reductase family protein [Streptacidiphilus sp. MAP12-16]|uniref:vitamin K epoxide reductase family protein n=1 Tax=Streptacidiphilus sp. MAP12-16 TaxID=3156300 RepID=UPI003513F175